MTPERQKGRVYYRCHTSDCATTTAREDKLESDILEKLQSLQINPEQADVLRAAWSNGTCAEQRSERQSSLKLQLAKNTARLERLLDLFVDGAIDETTYNAKKQTLEISIAALKEELESMHDIAQIERHRLQFLELMKNLAGLYQLAGRAEKREFVENAFSNRKVILKHVDLVPYDWLSPGKMNLPVFNGAQSRDTSRTFEATDGGDATPEIRKKRLIALLRTARPERNAQN